MTRKIVAVVLIALNCAVLFWASARSPDLLKAAFPALLAAVAIGAVVERAVAGRNAGWHARFHPAVVVAALAAFDGVLIGAALTRVT